MPASLSIQMKTSIPYVQKKNVIKKIYKTTTFLILSELQQPTALKYSDCILDEMSAYHILI